MSVKFHEAFCLDSARRRFEFTDHFLGDSVRDLWRSTGDAGGSAVVVDAQDGGVCRISTGATTNDDWRIDWGVIRSLHILKKVTMEWRMKAINSTYITLTTGLHFDGSNLAWFHCAHDASGNWFIRCIDDGSSTNVSSGVAVDTDWHIFRIECCPTGEVHYYIDGAETANSPIITDIPSDAADYLQPYFSILTREDVAKSMDIDYIWVRQDR